MREALKNAKRIVVKVGSSSLTHDNGKLNLFRIESIVKQLADAANSGKEIIFVSSGATAAGLPALGFKKKPTDIVMRQACAAVGQGVLLHMYETMFRQYGHIVAQVLLTREDTVKHTNYINLRNTLSALLRLGVIPIINENDVIAIEEFKIGDNDTLSANVASIIEADLLILLSDIDGLYTANPTTHPEATLISEVDAITPDIYKIAGGAGSSIGTGGMYTKIEAANIAVNSGIHMVITNGDDTDAIRHILLGKNVGTHFSPKETHLHTKKRWMAFGKRLTGKIYVDAGCKEALLTKGSSLLPAGVIEIEGEFNEGATVSVFFNDEELARGMANFSSADLHKIKGLNSSKIAQVLGINTSYEEVIHRDNLVVMR